MEYTINVTKEVLHSKYQIADEKVNELVRFLNNQISNERISNGSVVFKQATNDFKQVIKDALATYKATIYVDESVTYNDEEITEMMLKLENLKVQRDAILADADVISPETNFAFISIKNEITKFKDIKDKLILAGWIA